VLCLVTDEIVRTLGEGTFGKVTECRDLQKSVTYFISNDVARHPKAVKYRYCNCEVCFCVYDCYITDHSE